LTGHPKHCVEQFYNVLGALAGHGDFQKKVSINLTPGLGLICIFSKWPPVVGGHFICDKYHSKKLHFSTSRACFISVQVCSGKIHFYDLQKFSLETCSEKPEVDIMMPPLVYQAQAIQ